VRQITLPNGDWIVGMVKAARKSAAAIDAVDDSAGSAGMVTVTEGIARGVMLTPGTAGATCSGNR
jgi:hypothetical protein